MDIKRAEPMGIAGEDMVIFKMDDGVYMMVGEEMTDVVESFVPMVKYMPLDFSKEIDEGLLRVALKGLKRFPEDKYEELSKECLERRERFKEFYGESEKEIIELSKKNRNAVIG